MTWPVHTDHDVSGTGHGEVMVEASSLQRSIWLAEQLTPGPDGYAMPLVWRVHGGRIDPDQLRQAVAALIDRHEILRTAFVERDGALWQRIGAPWSPQVEHSDFAGLPADRQETAWKAWVRRVARRPFDIGSGRLLRPGLVDLGPAGQILLLCWHHLVCDGYSVAVLLADLDAFFRHGVMAPGAPQFREFVRAQQAWQAGDAGQRALDFWVDRLSGAPSHLPFPSVEEPTENGTVAVPLAADLSERLRDLRGEHGVSWFMVAATALAASLHRWSGLDDVTFGCQVANRTDENLAHVVGPCTNSVVLRSRCTADTTRGTLLDALRDQVLGALEHQEVPLDSVVRALRPPRLPGRTPYRDVVLNMTTLSARLRLGDYELEYLPTAQIATESKFSLAITVSGVGSRPWAVLSYRGDRYDAPRVRRMAERFGDMIGWLATAPADRCIGHAPGWTGDAALDAP